MDGGMYMWLQPGGDRLRKKGLGKDIMVSDFLTPGGRFHCTNNGSALFATRYHEYAEDDHWTGG